MLLEKLPAYGVKNEELLWFTDYLFGRQQFIQMGNNASSQQPIFSGVLQGSIIGPLLFLIFFNDVVDHLINSRVIKYADDTVVFFAGKDIVSIEKALTDDMDIIARYLDQKELVINLNKGKTEMMLFGTGKKVSSQTHQLKVMYRGVAIRNTDKVSW